MSILRITWIILAAASLLIVGAGGCRPTDEATTQNVGAALDPPAAEIDPLSELDRAGGLSAARIAEICAAAAGRVTGTRRQHCSEAHLTHATTLLDQKRYLEARSALAFAETAGAPLERVRALRRQIPRYDQSTGAISPEGSAASSSRESSRELRRAAASRFMSTFASSPLSGFDIKAVAAARDCSVLLVTFYVKMEDPMIEAMHRGDVMYGRIMPGGAANFAAQNGFRAVVYRDGYDTTWLYGDIATRDAKRIEACS